jgi:hypothetical protein
MLATLLLMLSHPAGDACAQQPGAGRIPPTTLSPSARVSLVTVLPGDLAWNLFGHCALRIHDPTYAFDASYNYGTFTFDEDFLASFVYGELDYFLSVYPFELLMADARLEQRSVVEQSLDLDADQRQALYLALMTNARPENRTYRYKFLDDNCSTRLGGILRAALGDDLTMPRGPRSESTFREVIDPLLVPHPWYDLGINLVLGSQLDEVAALDERWFMPGQFRDDIGRAVLAGRALVIGTETLYDSGRPDASARTAWPYPVIGAVIALLWLFVSARRARAGMRPSARFDALFLALCGLVGLILVLFWFATLHRVTVNNWNVLWAAPTHLFVAPLVWRRVQPGWLRIYLIVAGAAMLMAWIGGMTFLPQPLPHLTQLLVPWFACRLLLRGFSPDQA